MSKTKRTTKLYIYTQRERILQVLEDRNDRKSIEDKRNKVKEKRICK